MMMNSKRILALALGCVIAFNVSFAQGDALPFVRIVRDPVSASMGFAGVASGSETAYSSFRNSSVIPLSGDRFSTGFSYQNWAPDGVKTSNMNFGAAFKAGRFGFAVGGAYQMGEEYTTADASGNPKGTFSPNDMIVNGGVGLRILDNLSAGANMCYASEAFRRQFLLGHRRGFLSYLQALGSEHHRRSVFHRFFREVGFGGFIQFAGIGHDWRGLGQAIL